jgi:pimeloyl-ACP methyl ester carboxylesterase
MTPAMTLAGLFIVVAIVAGFALLVIQLGFRAPRVRERGDPGGLGAAFDTVSIPSVNGKRLFGYDYEDIAPVNTVCDIHCPILLIHGRDDRTVPVSDALAIERGCPGADIELLLFDGADHESVERIEVCADVLLRFVAHRQD